MTIFCRTKKPIELEYLAEKRPRNVMFRLLRTLQLLFIPPLIRTIIGTIFWSSVLLPLFLV